MIAKSNNKGFTLLELLAVFAILIIILTFVVPKVLATIDNSKTEIDKTNLEALNRATGQYEYFLNLENENLPQDLTQQILLDAGFINDILEPHQPDKVFDWDNILTSWSYVDIDSTEESSEGGFDLNIEDFIEDILDDYEGEAGNEQLDPDVLIESGVVITDNWEVIITEEGESYITITSGDEASFSVDHEIEGSYTIIVDAEANSPGSSITLDGVKYGIFFESLSNPQSYDGINSGFLFEVSYIKEKGEDKVFYSFYEVVEDDDNLLLKQSSKEYDSNLGINVVIDVIDGDQIKVNIKDKDGEETFIEFPEAPNIFNISNEKTYAGIIVARGNGEDDNAIFYDIKIHHYNEE